MSMSEVSPHVFNHAAGKYLLSGLELKSYFVNQGVPNGKCEL